MAKERDSLTCECGNEIIINYYHHVDGENYKEKVRLKCNACGKKFDDVVKNIESATISGAEVVYV